MPATVEREKELIARIIAGETDLFHELIRPYERMVYLSILTMLRNDQEAEDAAQEVMINAFRHLKSFRGDAKFSTWLVTIAMNEARQRLRKAKAAQFESLDEGKEDREGDFTPGADRLAGNSLRGAGEKRDASDIARGRRTTASHLPRGSGVAGP